MNALISRLDRKMSGVVHVRCAVRRGVYSPGAAHSRRRGPTLYSGCRRLRMLLSILQCASGIAPNATSSVPPLTSTAPAAHPHRRLLFKGRGGGGRDEAGAKAVAAA